MLMRYDMFLAKQNQAAPDKGSNEPTPGTERALAKTYGIRDERLLKEFLLGKQAGAPRASSRGKKNYTYDELLKDVEAFWRPRIEQDIESDPRDAQYPQYIQDMFFAAFPKTYVNEDGNAYQLSDVKPFSEHEPDDSSEDELTPIFVAIGKLLQRSAEDAEKSTREKLMNMSEKQFDAYRWTGPSTQDTASGQEREPRAIRAVLQFGKHPLRETGTHFRLHYHPYVKTDPRYKFPANVLSGYAVPFGHHVLFVGVENGSTHPVFILCDFGGNWADRFGGFVIRRSDSDTKYFMSRVFFLENGDGKKLSDVKTEIGIYSKSEMDTAFAKNVIELLNDTFRNSADLEGKQALVLRRL